MAQALRTCCDNVDRLRDNLLSDQRGLRGHEGVSHLVSVRSDGVDADVWLERPKFLRGQFSFGFTPSAATSQQVSPRAFFRSASA